MLPAKNKLFDFVDDEDVLRQRIEIRAGDEHDAVPLGDQALVAARTAAEKKPDDPRFDSRIAWIYYHAKRYDDAVTQYRALLKKYDENYDSPEARSVVHDTRLILSNIAVLQEKLPEAEIPR